MKSKTDKKNTRAPLCGGMILLSLLGVQARFPIFFPAVLEREAQAVLFDEKTTRETLEPLAKRDKDSDLGVFFRAIEKFNTDDVAAQIKNKELLPIIGRESEAERAIDILARMRGKIPVFVGEPGVGKTSVAELVAQKIVRKETPAGSAFAPIKNSVMVQVSVPSISSMAASTSKNSQQNIMSSFLKGWKEAEKILKKKIIVSLPQMHTLQSAMYDILHNAIEGNDGVQVIGETTHSALYDMLRENPSLKDKLEPVVVRELTAEEAFHVMKQSWIPVLEKHYDVQFTDQGLRAAIRAARDVHPDSLRIRGPFRLIQDVAVQVHRAAGGKHARISEKEVGDTVVYLQGTKLNPYDRSKFNQDIDELREVLRESVVDQERYTDAMVDLWRDLNQGSGKKHRVLLAAGPTGAGKSFGGQVFAKEALGSEERFLEINGAMFNYGQHSLNTLIGSPPGTVSSQEFRGVIPEFLDGKGRGQNVIQINEIDKAHPDVMKVLMEMLDTGVLEARDGKKYHLGKSLVVLTTNKGDDLIYPRGRAKPLTRTELETRLAGIGDQQIREEFMKPESTNLYDHSKDLPPSVMNRIDKAVPVAPPSYEGAQKIMRQHAKALSRNFFDEYRFHVEVSPEIARYIVDHFYIPEDGIRDPKRHLEKLVNDAVRAFEGQNQAREDEAIRVGLLQGEKNSPPRIIVDSSRPGIRPVEFAGPVKHKQRFVFDPADRGEFNAKIDRLRETLREKVVDQARYTDEMVDQWRDLNRGAGKSHRVILAAGPTGSGKSFGGQTFAREALGSEDRFLEINGSMFNYGEHSLNTLLGSPPGTVSSNSFRGLLPEFLDGKGKGQNVIQINELDKAHPDVLKALMEMLDTGTLDARDGKKYQLGKSLVILTTNKGDDEIFPRGRATPLSRGEIEKRLKKIGDREVRGFFMKPDTTHLYDKSKLQPASVLQRIDAAVPVAPPSFEGAETILRQHAEALSRKFFEQHQFNIDVSPEVLHYMVKSFYFPEDGVRDAKRHLEKLVNDALDYFEKSGHLEEGQTLSISMQPGEGSRPPIMKATTSPTDAQTAEFAAPVDRRVPNPLVDLKARAKLAGLEERLEKSVFGQPEAINTTAKAVRIRAANQQIKTPAVTLDLGPTGIGKTELGKALAAALFGDPEAYQAFDMGKIKSLAQLQNIFGSPRGFAGSGEMSPFEQFLKFHPDGGVITFDEIGNMGNRSDNTSNMEDLLHQFYSMLDEGEWVSPLGERYDLRKYVLRFTSNEGQEFFADTPSDERRLRIWKEAAKKEKLVSLLKSKGWPEALIGRLQGNISLYRPSTSDTRIQIAKKMIDQTLRELKEQHGFRSFAVDDDFYKNIGDSFFSHTEGARSMRAGNTELTDLFTEALFDGLSEEKLRNASFRVSLSDNFQGKFRFRGKTPPEREVLMKLQVDVPGQASRSYSRNIAESAPEHRLANPHDGLKTAIHEAGHAVVNDPHETGERLTHVTIRGAGGYRGYAGYEPVPGAVEKSTRGNAVATIGRSLAGGLSEEYFYGREGKSGGWSGDLKSAREIAENAVTRYGLTESTLKLPIKDGKVVMENRKVQKEIEQLLKEGETYAKTMIQRKLPEIRAVAGNLYHRGHLDAEEFEAIIATTRSTQSLRPLSERQTATGSLRRPSAERKNACVTSWSTILEKK